MRKFEPAKCYTFDFECTSREPAQVYLCAVARLSKLEMKHVKVFRNIAETVDYIFSRGNKSKFYAHNLKYDISFVLCYLFQNFKGQFTVTNSIIQELTKSVVTMTIAFRGKEITFIDTLPIFSAPLKSVMAAFTDMEKGETPLFDYIEDVKVTDYEIEYCKGDALGLAKAIIKRLEYGQGSLTTASDAFKTFKELVSGKSAGRFERFYRPLPPEIDDIMRPAYRGGFTYLNPEHANTMLEGVHVIDVNSMYPAQMYHKMLPYGEPRIVEDGEVKPTTIYCLGIQMFSIDSCQLREGYAPFLSTANTLMHAAAYLSEITGDMPLDKRTFSMTMEEFSLFKRSYDVQGLKYHGGFLFKGRNDMFKPYIDKYWKLKSDKNPTIKTIGKLFLNSLYGKFAEGYNKSTFNVYYDEGLKYELQETEIRPCGYLPVGIFITAYARIFLLETINAIGIHNFIYTDTDSIHYFRRDNNDADIYMHDTELGAWDHENYFNRAYYIRAKRYCGEIVDEETGSVKLKIACAGIKTAALKEQVTRIEDFKSGRAIKTIEFKQGVNGQYVRDKYIKI